MSSSFEQGDFLMRHAPFVLLLIAVFTTACESDDLTTSSSPAGAAGSTGLPVAATGSTAGVSAGATVPTGTAGATPTAGSSATGRAGTGSPQPSAAGSGTGTAGASAAGASAAGAGVAGASGTASVGAAGTDAVSTAGSGAAGSSAAGTGAAGSAAAGSGGAAGSVASEFKRPCIADGNEVVFIGDSYSDYGIAHRSMASFVEQHGRMDGALKTGDTYRNLAVAGTTLAAPPAAIQSQWTSAMSMKPVKVVVMSGGGNDVLINNTQCRPEGSEARAECKAVVQASLDATKKMFASMKEAGVSDVIFFWYPHIPGGLLTGYEKGTSISDYTFPMLDAIAKSASTDTFHAYMVPTVEIFEGHPEYFYSDGLHANDTGTAKISDAIWKVMKDNCIGQASSSGCCAP